MCGRGTCSLDPNTLKRVCNVRHFVNSHQYSPSYNICPSTFIPVLLQRSEMNPYCVLNTKNSNDDCKDSEVKDITNNSDDDQILSAMRIMRWGLIPSFSKSSKMQFNTINARQESVTSKPMYRRLVNRKRCVVLMNGYYEWKMTTNQGKAKGKSKEKQPYYFTPKYSTNDAEETMQSQLALDPPLMYMAALWDVWKSKDDPLAPPLFTVTIITTNSSDDVSFCHHRMPLLMTKECVSSWINVEKYPIDECFKMIAAERERISIRNKAVPRHVVGNVRNKGIECIQSVDEEKSKTRKGGLHKFFQSVKPKPTKSSKGMDIDSQTEDETDHEMMEAIAASKESFEKEKQKKKKRKLKNEDKSNVQSKRQKLNDGSSVKTS